MLFNFPSNCILQHFYSFNMLNELIWMYKIWLSTYKFEHQKMKVSYSTNMYALRATFTIKHLFNEILRKDAIYSYRATQRLVDCSTKDVHMLFNFPSNCILQNFYSFNMLNELVWMYKIWLSTYKFEHQKIKVSYSTNMYALRVTFTIKHLWKTHCKQKQWLPAKVPSIFVYHKYTLRNLFWLTQPTPV